MKFLLTISLLLILSTTSGPLEEAHSLFENKQYPAALAKYRSVLTQFPDQSHEIYFNIGQCYMAMDSLDKALAAYYQSLSAEDEETTSLAYNQIGIIFAQNKQYPKALESFQKAVRMNSFHLDAAFNYELIRRIMEAEQENQEKPQEEMKEEGPDQSNDEEGDQQKEEEGSESDEESEEEREEEKEKKAQDASAENAQQPANNDQAIPFTVDTLNMDRARQLLDRMRENEMRFMQELRKTTKAGEKTGRPDW